MSLSRRFAAALVFALACGSDDGPSSPPPTNGGSEPTGIALEQVVEGLDEPVYLTAPPGDARLFIVEQPGRVLIVRDGQLQPTPYLDLRSTVHSGGNEQGLLGMAFHPDFANNGVFYLNFTIQGGDTRIVRYVAGSPTSDVANPATGDTILAVEQPSSNHNGGMLAFGPDGYLYVALGDGGGSGDPRGNGQDSTTVLGAILRLTDDGDPAPGNPFLDNAGDDRIWAWGLRNPWRFAFDLPSGLLFIADVGQSAREEVNVVASDRAGVNFGWNVMEGRRCYGQSSCDQGGLELPVYEYTHADGCSVTGGFVYRGSAVPDAAGRYFFADFCSAFVRSFLFEGGQATDVVEHDLGSLGPITSFGVDGQGELYIIERGGRVLRFVPEQD